MQMMEKDRIFEAVKRNVLVVMPEVEPAEISLEQHLADLGCNSIDRAEIVTLTMEELAVTVPIMEFSEVNNIRTLVELFRRYLP